MNYDEEYEDELDRMKARRQKRSRQTYSTSPEASQNEDFEFIEDIYNTNGVQAAGSFKKPGRAAAGRQRDYASHDSSRRSLKTPGRKGAGGPDGGRHPHSQGKRRKKHGIWKVLLLLAVLLAGIFLYRSFAKTGYWTVAVFGVDSRDGNMGKGALSDVIMLCSINRKTGDIRLVSVFRDSYLRIDEDGSYDKINEAYFLGGHKQAVKALEDNLGLKIDDYATFNWSAVVNAINALGGVDLEITDKEFAYINSFITETVNSTNIGSHHLEHSGMNHLDGVQAVAYARLRLMDTDFNRTERQRKVLGLAMEKAKQAGFDTLKDLVSAVLPQVSTSVGIDDILSVAKNAKKYYISQTSGFPFSHSEIKIGKKSCVIPTTLESNVIQLHQFLYDDAQYTPSETVRAISARIAQESGLSDPGKDTESGKNVGAQGNTGGGQEARPARQTDPAPETAMPETPVPETPVSETETTAETTAEESSSSEEETYESESSSEEESAETTVPPSEASQPGHTSESETEDSKQPVTAGGSPSGADPAGPGAGPGEAGPGGAGPANTPNASLEAPGQNEP